MQTNLRTDNFCGYNQAAAPFYYVFQPGQYNDNRVIGEVGVNPAGGTAGTYVRSEVIDVDSYLSGRDETLSRCTPVMPSLKELDARGINWDDKWSSQNTRKDRKSERNDGQGSNRGGNVNFGTNETKPEIKQGQSTRENFSNLNDLTPKETRTKKSASDLSTIDYNRWEQNMSYEPQDLRFVIEAFAPQRGGMDTRNYIKSAWHPTTERGSAINGDPKACKSIMRPGFACGKECDEVSGYAGGWKGDIIAEMPGKPQSDYPFIGITSQQIKAVGATECGEQQFYGPRYTEGSCGKPSPLTVLKDNTKNVKIMPEMRHRSFDD